MIKYCRLIAIFAIITIVNISLFAQSKNINRDNYSIHIIKTEEEINIDGLLDEEIWSKAEKAGNFHRVTPTDTGYALAQTEVMLAYDKLNIYMGVICYDPTPGKRPVESLRRDFDFYANDNFAVHIDTYNDFTNGFAFRITAAGAEAEGSESEGTNINWSWDNKWKSAVKNYDNQWVVEISIPFRSLRYLKGAEVWGINFGRLDLKTNEKSAWAPMPRQIPHNDLAYTGSLIWDKPLEKSGLRFSIIPYVKGKVTKNNQIEENEKWSAGAGFDTKIMLSTSMNLDLTVNPDYSQVEEDRQQTNLDRFELFFPERRQFFLENSDLFADLGSRSVRPFFSRRIGLDVPVNAGFRLSGKIGNKWRTGLMDMQTGEKNEIPNSNYAVAVIQRQVFSRSNITGFFINKQIAGNYNDSLYHGYDFNRIAGIEYNLASLDKKWTGKAFYHHSFYPGSSGDAATVAGDLTFSTRFFKTSLSAAWVGADYVAEAGYVRRTGYFETSPSMEYTFYPSSSIVLSHGPRLSFDIITDPEFKMTDRQTQLSYSIGFQDRSMLSFNISEEFVLLDHPYDPTNTNGVMLSPGEQFAWQTAGVSFTSDSRKLFTYSMHCGYGSYFNGTRWNMNGSISYRVQPYGSISIAANYNNISLPDPYNSAELLLISPRLDITFTNKLFFTTFVQYNNQIDNLNTNIRLQWRFAPVSDLFIVYTGNSFTNDFSNKNRGLVLKLSYWFN
jgi:hypothetical protein